MRKLINHEHLFCDEDDGDDGDDDDVMMDATLQIESRPHFG